MNVLISYCEGKFISKYIATIGVDYGVKPVDLGDFQVRGEPKRVASCSEHRMC